MTQKYEVQMHFKNQGQLVWNKEFDSPMDAQDWLADITCRESDHIDWDEDNKRAVFFSIDELVAVFATQKSSTEDLMDNLYLNDGLDH